MYFYQWEDTTSRSGYQLHVINIKPEKREHIYLWEPVDVNRSKFDTNQICQTWNCIYIPYLKCQHFINTSQYNRLKYVSVKHQGIAHLSAV